MKLMKRVSYVLLLGLMLFMTIGSAAAKTRSHKKPKETLVDQQPGPPVRSTPIKKEKKDTSTPAPDNPSASKKPVKIGPPVERHLTKANGKVFDVRSLPHNKPVERERPEREGPEPDPIMAQPTTGQSFPPAGTQSVRQPVVTAAAPPPIITFDGLDRQNWVAGSPPDTNGDAGPTHYIQTVNTSIGIYRKSDGFQEAAFTFDTLMSQGNFGNQCDNHNFGDPVVLYDTFEDRWIITDFAFTLDVGNNVNPPIAFQCFAVSMNSDPISGGWNFYSIAVTDGLNDYPKFGIWPDGLYMSANMFGYAAGGSFQGSRVWAFNKAQMYAGSATVKIVTFDIGTGDFTVIP